MQQNLLLLPKSLPVHAPKADSVGREAEGKQTTYTLLGGGRNWPTRRRDGLSRVLTRIFRIGSNCGGLHQVGNWCQKSSRTHAHPTPEGSPGPNHPAFQIRPKHSPLRSQPFSTPNGWGRVVRATHILRKDPHLDPRGGKQGQMSPFSSLHFLQRYDYYHYSFV